MLIVPIFEGGRGLDIQKKEKKKKKGNTRLPSKPDNNKVTTTLKPFHLYIWPPSENVEIVQCVSIVSTRHNA